MRLTCKPLINIGEGRFTRSVLPAADYTEYPHEGVAMVFVLNNKGKPLMPTNRHGKIRHLLKEGKAKVVQRCPFTIMLLYESTNFVQPVSLGMDAGSKTIGISATTKDKVLLEEEIKLRTDITKNLSDRRELRRARRNRKTRYRKPRFLNRVHTKKKGWLAPTIHQKIETHLSALRSVCRLLPISEIIIETASFDIQKIRNPNISGKEYQEGDQLGFWNIREYVLFRDGHQCQCCKGKSKDTILNVHHIESRKTGGDAPNNLITLCETCHKGYHAGTVELPKSIRRGMSSRDAAFMGTMRWALLDTAKALYEPAGISVKNTYGYITKNTRIENSLPKEHRIDARCISGHPKAKDPEEWFLMQKVRRHNRQLHKMTIQKDGIRKSNQAPYKVKGFRRFDVVKARGRLWYVHGRRASGAFVLKNLDGEKLEISPSKIVLVAKQNAFVIERRLPDAA